MSDIDNTASNYGAQGIFYGPVVFGPPPFIAGNAPPAPGLFVGRDNDVHRLRTRLARADESTAKLTQARILVRGWPGVGKTTLAAALVYDTVMHKQFPDGVLWASLGQEPSVLSELAAWGRALGAPDLNQVPLEEARARLNALLRDKRMLLVVDDAWKTEQAEAFRLGGPGCAILVTTRLNDVAQALAEQGDNLYVLDVLDEESGIELLREIASDVVSTYPDDCRELVNALEGLPLALHVAGRLLRIEHQYGLPVQKLLDELRERARLLEELAPANRGDLANETTPTIAALLKKSTDLLDEESRERYAFLGAFAPNPATFDLGAMQAVWEVEDASSTVRILLDRGLLEYLKERNRYWVHALLVTHAISLCDP